MSTKHPPGPKFEKVKAPIFKDSHTPGPWIITDCLKSLVIYGPDGSIAEVRRYADKHNTDHNARLIAAAPELLEALKTLLHNYSIKNMVPVEAVVSHWKNIESIIAKAEGRE